MNFKDMLQKISQLSEATEKTKTGTKHTADAGGYGRKFDTDEEGDEKKKDTNPAAKRGRGRPAKGSDDTGTVKKYDTKGVGDVFGAGKKPKKEVGTTSKKHTLKDWFEHMESKMLAEAEQVTMEPAKQNTQVIKQGTKTLGTVSNPQLASQIKQSIGKGEMSLAGDQLGEEEENYSAKKARAGKDIGKPGKNFAKIATSAGKKYGSKDAGERVAGAILAKLRGAHESVEEAEIPSSSGVDTIGAALGAGRSKTTLEGKNSEKKKCPPMSHIKKMCKDGKTVAQICKMHPDCDQKELKQMVADCKKTLDEASLPMTKVNGKSVPTFAADGKGKNDLKKKKAVKEGMSHRLQAARLEGKAHGLKGHSHCGKNYQDMEEARVYHEGYKEGLDECYGQMPVRGLVGEGDPAATVPGMDSQEMETMPTMEDDMYEMGKTDYMKQQARKTPGDTFKAFGQTMHDRDVLENDFAFEAWDKELSNLLTEGEDKIEEGMTVSISKGQQGAPDSVSISAQDAEAEHLLAFVKNAGLGLFGDDSEHSNYGAPEEGGSSEKNAPGGIEVVGDHDGMMGMLQKLSGIQQSGDDEASDYADEEGHEDSCNECGGMMEAGHSCGSKEMVDEVESEDQMEFEVAEANAPDSGEAEERDEEETDSTRDAALATAAGKNFANTDAPVNEEDDDDNDKEVKEAYTFENMYKKIAMLSEESTSEKDDKAEKAAKKVAKDIEYDEGHKGKDDNRAEKAGEKVKKDIEYDDKKDKKEKIDEWANEAGPDKKGTDASFEEDIDFMMNIISGGLNKRKSTGQTTIPVVASQLNRTVSHNTTDINESNLVSDWKKLAGIIK